MKTRFVTLVVTTALCVATARADSTNPVWDIIIPEMNDAAVSGEDFFHTVEFLSRRYDPQNKGIRVLHSMAHSEISVRGTNVSIRSMLDSWGETVFTPDTAVVFNYPERSALRVAALTGRCVDAMSGEPVTTLTLETWASSNLRMPATAMISRDGSFVAAVPYSIHRAYCWGMTLANLDRDSLDLIITAPGYETLTNHVQVGDFYSRHEQPKPLDIKLRRIRASESMRRR